MLLTAFAGGARKQESTFEPARGLFPFARQCAPRGSAVLRRDDGLRHGAYRRAWSALRAGRHPMLDPVDLVLRRFRAAARGRQARPASATRKPHPARRMLPSAAAALPRIAHKPEANRG